MESLIRNLYYNKLSMKKLLTILLLLPLLIFAQVPQGVGYQGVATDAAGFELINQSISIRASILSNSATGTIEWQEIHNTSTDTFGLFNLTIGQGTTTGNGAQANFADISWGASTHFLRIEMDVNGGSNYSFMGTNQLMSVPYALYAENANINYDSISTLLSNDSTFITTVSGGIGGGCDFKYPDGLDGEYITESINPNDINQNNYIVPAGKTLYINTIWKSPAGNSINFTINGIELLSGSMNTDNGGSIISPFILNAGDVLEGTISFNGILITNSNITSITHSLSNLGQNTDYVVPSGKSLHITQVNSSLAVNGIGLILSSNDQGYYYNLSLANVISVAAGDIISGLQYNDAFNGYLADENYFSDCGGGGGSTSTVDSSYIDSLVQFYSSGGGGGCDLKFPEGVNGESITVALNTGTSYTVPSGKRLYITTKYGGNNTMNINGVDIQTYEGELHLPLVANSGDIISPTYSTININGILVNESSNLQAISTILYSGTSYTVPFGKRLYITAKYGGNNIMNINGIDIQTYESNFHLHIIANAGDIVAPTYSQININGYLVDDNYFADCGGASSSSTINSLNNYGFQNFISDSIFIVPSGVNTLYINLNSARGGDGQNTNVLQSNGGGSIQYNLYGCPGGNSLSVDLILNCNEGDSIAINFGSPGIQPQLQTVSNIYQSASSAGSDGGTLKLYINSLNILDISGGEGGAGITFNGMNFSCWNLPGNDGEIIYRSEYSTYPVFVISSKISALENVATIKY